MRKGAEDAPDLDMTVADIVARWPAAKDVLVRRGLDLCCGGIHPLRMAAQAHGQDADEVLAELRKAVSGAR